MKYFVKIYIGRDASVMVEEFTLEDLDIARIAAKSISEFFPRVEIQNSTGFHTEVWEDGIKTY